MRPLNRALLAAATLQLVATGGALAQNVSGVYAGHFKATKWPATAISLNVKQGQPFFPNQVTANYAAAGLSGSCSGFLVGNVANLTCQNALLLGSCWGQYYGLYTFSAGGVSWTFSGADCRGSEQGNGAAFKTSQRRRAHRRAK